MHISFLPFSFFFAGHYAYVDLAVLSLGKSTARLASEPLASTTGSCLWFHYHMDFLGHSCKSGEGSSPPPQDVAPC